MAIIIANDPDSKAHDMVLPCYVISKVKDALTVSLEILKQVEAQPI